MADLLFEIGAEEIPAGFVPPALEQLERDLAKALDDARIAHGEVKAASFPDSPFGLIHLIAPFCSVATMRSLRPGGN